MTASAPRCLANTRAGFGCINKAKDGVYCPGHDPRNMCHAPTVAGGRCRRMKSFGTDRCSKHQGVATLPGV